MPLPRRHAAADSRAAIEATQRELAQAQDAFTERDPLSAAKWFARAAADSLSRQPPDLHGANPSGKRERGARAGLGSHDPRGRRATPRCGSLACRRLRAESPHDATTPGTTGSAPGFAAAREWNRLLPRDYDNVNVTLHESDPAGYEESLKLYFEALGNAQEGKGN